MSARSGWIAPLLAPGLVVLALLAAPAVAVEPNEILPDPALEARARAISQDLRCMVCQNQSIDESNAGLARDLRVLVRERLVAGDSNPQVVDYVSKRYGDYVLLRPPFKASTYLLWLAPLIVLALGAVGVALFYRGRRRASPGALDTPPLSAEESRRLDRLLRSDQS